MDGLRTRVTISVKRVLDSCRKQLTLENTKLPIKIRPGIPPPHTFVNAASTGAAAKISKLSIARLEERPCFARIKCQVTIPLRVIYKDAEGQEHSTDSHITIPQDVVLYVPEASVFPFEIVAVASATSFAGKFPNANTLECRLCLTTITKVVAETDLMLPAYGYCPSPNAVDFEEQACNKFFDLPLYPR